MDDQQLLGCNDEKRSIDCEWRSNAETVIENGRTNDGFDNSLVGYVIMGTENPIPSTTCFKFSSLVKFVSRSLVCAIP